MRLGLEAWVRQGLLMLLLFVFPRVRQDFDVPTTHLIGAHGYCTQVRGAERPGAAWGWLFFLLPSLLCPY